MKSLFKTASKFLLLLITLFNSNFLSAQNYTTSLADNPAGSFIQTDNVILERFRPSSNPAHAFDGTVMFRALLQNNGINDLDITLLDNTGTHIFSNRFTMATHGVPKAAAYNSLTHEYIVTGDGDALVNGNGHDVWYLVLDEDLVPLHFGAFELITASPMGGSANTNIVTDVCPIEVTNSSNQFAFVGMILHNGITPHPKVGPGFYPTDRRMFITTLETTTFTTNSQEYEFDIAGTACNEFFFPSRIIEVANGANFSQGFLVAGTGTDISSTSDAKGYFYFRAGDMGGGAALASTACLVIDDNTSTDFFTMSAMQYDHNVGKVKVAGSMTGNGFNAFIFDKLTGLASSTNINPFCLNASFWNGNLGIKKIYSSNGIFGTLKVGIIGSDISNNNKITGRTYAGAHATKNLPVLFDCDYDDTDLDMFTTNQNNNIYYYPRVNDPSIATQFYSGHRPNEIWYPNHSGHQIWNTGGSGALDEYGFSGLLKSGANFIPVMMTTDNYYINDCNQDDQQFDLDLIPITSASITVTDYTPNQTDATVSYIGGTFGIIQDYCDPATNPFKNAPGGLTDAITSDKDFSVFSDGVTLKVQCVEATTHYGIRSVSGTIVASGSVHSGSLNLSTSQMPRGIYLLELFDKNNIRLKTMKFSL